jgi:hypothetical protein
LGLGCTQKLREASDKVVFQCFPQNYSRSFDFITWLLKLLENLLPAPGGPAVLTAINETASAMTTRCQELIYRRGLEDGAELIRILTRSAREQEQKQKRDQESGE